MATAAERVAAMRARRRRGEVQVNVVVSERDLVKIAGAGYAGAVSTDKTSGADAITSFIIDSLAGVLAVVVSRRDLRRLALRGYTDAVSTGSALRANGVASLVSDTVTGDAGIA